MKKRLLPALALLLFIAYACQPDQESKSQLDVGIERGNFKPGMIDTILFHPTEPYSFGEYSGPKPFFVKIWVPVRTTSEKSLTYSDLFKFEDLDPKLIPLYDTLNKGYIGYVRHRLTKTIGDEDSTLKSKSEQMFDQLSRLTIRSRYTEKPEGKFPVIVYHHGYGGWSHENFLFAEYMAANGFVVIGTNYEWPNHEGGWDEGKSDLKYILNFAKHLPYADSTQVFAVGHSWGAQSVLYYDSAPAQPFQSTIALHTTMRDRFHWTLSLSGGRLFQK
ncbi:MAG TPA: hypothetical protein VGD40_12645 [Chryseosolibacter sp.]